MTARPRKTTAPGLKGLQPLPPQEAQALKDMVAQVAAALESGQDPQSLPALVAPRPQDFLWDLHLLAALGTLAHPAVPPLLAALFGPTQDKVRRKALKRTLHLLKTRGVAVPAELFLREEPPRPQPSAGPPPLAYVSPIFGPGERYVLLEGPKETLGGNLLVARVSDMQGFRECLLLSLKRRQRQEFWEHLRSQGLGEMATVPAAYAVGLLEEACRHDAAAPGASRYAALKERIYAHWARPEAAPDLEQVLPGLNPAEHRRYLEQSRQLALDPLFFSWLPAAAEITPWMQKIKEVQDSPMVLSEQQQQVRLDGVVEEATGALYPQASRPYWRRRLQHMAYYLDLQGRQEEARAAQAAAADLEESHKGPLSEENPFLKALTLQALMLAWELEKKDRGAAAGAGLVAPPSEPLIIRR